MKFIHFKHTSPGADDSKKEYAPELISHQNQLDEESDGGEFSDDAIRTHEQPYFDAKERTVPDLNPE